MIDIETLSRNWEAADNALFRDVALRGHILQLVEPDATDDNSREHYIVTPFNKAGEPNGDAIAIAYASLTGDDIVGWITRTPVILTEAELPERLKDLDIYGRNAEERAAHKVEWGRQMIEFERELILCAAPKDVLH